MTIPATPNSGTADTSPLVSYVAYQQVTGDTTIGNQDDFDVVLDDALDLFQRKTRRTLLYGQYTERLYVYRNGQVYPTATPLDTVKGVMSPSGTPPENVGIFQGNGIWVGWYTPIPGLPFWLSAVPPQTDITYWGGYVGPSSPLAEERLLPASIKRILCRICWYASHPATMAGIPAGARSVSVGGVSVSGSGDLSLMVDSDVGLRRDIKRWRHPQAHAWDGQSTS
jgi:hypothetical protein